MKPRSFLLPAIVLAALFLLVIRRVEFDAAGQPPRLLPDMTERMDASFSPPPSAVPYGREEAPTPDGAKLFQQHCAHCHGAEGRADTFVARQPGMPDVGNLAQPLSSPDKQGDILRRGQGAMPAFGSRLSPAQQEALLQHLPTLRSPSSLLPSS